jgi:hypothetical protein
MRRYRSSRCRCRVCCTRTAVSRRGRRSNRIDVPLWEARPRDEQNAGANLLANFIVREQAPTGGTPPTCVRHRPFFGRRPGPPDDKQEQPQDHARFEQKNSHALPHSVHNDLHHKPRARARCRGAACACCSLRRSASGFTRSGRGLPRRKALYCVSAMPGGHARAAQSEDPGSGELDRGVRLDG